MARSARRVALVCDDLSHGFGQRIAGHAFYELGETHRLLGNPEAEDAYRRAGECGAPVQPGLAMLRLAQDDVDTAVVGIRRALAETQGRLERLGLLSACVTIMLAAGNVDAARAAVDEMELLAEVYDTAAVKTEVAAASGAVALAEGEPATALPRLRSAARWWREIGAPRLSPHCPSSSRSHVEPWGTKRPPISNSSRRRPPSPGSAPALICVGWRPCCTRPSPAARTA